ncbi:MAG TPA: hypothetical protein VFX16_34100 [Pseudonocardiaceae bacterium]|nr:hypothetical protein [Pseudonocardiaceae bacterium]
MQNVSAIGFQHGVADRLAALLLVAAGVLAVGGSFGTLEAEAERAGTSTLTLTYTSWRLTQGGTYTTPIYFHAPHFGIPLVAAGALTIVGGLLLALVGSSLARPIALVTTGMLVGTVWTVGLVVSADLDAVTSSASFELTWTTGIGFWLVLAGGIVAAAGGIVVLLPMTVRRRRVEPPTPVPLPVFPPPEPADPA